MVVAIFLRLARKTGQPQNGSVCQRESEVPLRPLWSEVCDCSFLLAYPADPGCADTSKPGRSRRLPHSGAHSAYPRRTVEPVRQDASESLFSSILIAPEIAFSFSCATFFMACCPFFWLWSGHCNQAENRPFFKYPLSKCAQFSGRYHRHISNMLFLTCITRYTSWSFRPVPEYHYKLFRKFLEAPADSRALPES